MSTIGISISTSIILGLLTFLIGFFDTYIIIPNIKLLIFVFSFFSLFNMIMAGVFSLKLIGDLNLFYKIFPSQIKLDEKEKKKLTAKNIEINVIYNILRNNNLYASYKSLIISIFCLIFVFIIVLLPIHTKNEDNDLQHIYYEIDILQSNQDHIKNELLEFEETLLDFNNINRLKYDSIKSQIIILKELIISEETKDVR